MRINLSNDLFNKSDIVEPYPDDIAKISAMCSVTAFFPGGRGFLNLEKKTMPSILILGQDFATQSEYLKMYNENKSELNCPTWRNLRELLSDVEINLDDCFFSNVFMGLRTTKSGTGKFPGYKDKDFVKRNTEFLKIQIDTIKPELIITLGKYAADMLHKNSVSDLQSWENGNVLKLNYEGLKENVNFENHQCTCVALEHPSFRNINVKRRLYKEKIGNEAELEMLFEAKEICKLKI